MSRLEFLSPCPEKLVPGEVSSLLEAFPNGDKDWYTLEHLFLYRDYFAYLGSDALLEMLPIAYGLAADYSGTDLDLVWEFVITLEDLMRESPEVSSELVNNSDFVEARKVAIRYLERNPSGTNE